MRRCKVRGGWRRRALALALGPGCIACALAAQPYRFESTPGRLPKNVVPLDYSVSLVPDASDRSLRGAESVTLEFREPGASVVLNALELEVSEARLDGAPVQGISADPKQQTVTLLLDKPAPAGRHTLTLSFYGKLGTRPPGVFVQSFVKPGGGKGELVSTKFEPTHARRMFPCWDEPAFRATFELAVTLPRQWAAISNMPVATRVENGATATTTFQRTPRMPSYLVELTGGDLARISAQSGATEIGVWAVRGQEQDGRQALADAQQILSDYNEYFGIAFPLPKLDSIAIPGGFPGAMENWGAITYNDQFLLLTPTSTLENRQGVFDFQAHEIAHQWNGDLVTMAWWDDLWLNESFANWRGAKEVDERHANWNWWEQRDANRERAMRADARINSHAIAQHVSDETQAQNAFDPLITYDKGQAVLRMFEAYLGPATFRDGVQRLMKEHAYSNASSADLWNALAAASGKPVGEIVAGWVERPGFPVVSVRASCDGAGKRSIALSQRRFLWHGTDPAAPRWSVPMQLRVGGGVPQSVLLEGDGLTVSAGRCDESLSANAGAIGFYRVSYDEATLRANIANAAAQPRGDRIALLDDVWALVEAGEQPLGQYLSLAKALGPEPEERAWSQVVEALAMIEHDERDNPGHGAFAAYARSVVRPVAERLGWAPAADETPGTRTLRRTLLNRLGAWGDSDVLAEARRRYARFIQDHKQIEPDDQEFVLSIVAGYADKATFEQIHALAKSAANETEMRRYYMALMGVRDPGLARQAAAIAVSQEIPAQAETLRLRMLALLSYRYPQLSWETFKTNLDAVLAPFGQYRPMITAQVVPEIYWNALAQDQLEAWIRAQVPQGLESTVDRGMEAARFREAERQALVPAADRYLASQGLAAP